MSLSSHSLRVKGRACRDTEGENKERILTQSFRQAGTKGRVSNE